MCYSCLGERTILLLFLRSNSDFLLVAFVRHGLRLASRVERSAMLQLDAVHSIFLLQGRHGITEDTSDPRRLYTELARHGQGQRDMLIVREFSDIIHSSFTLIIYKKKFAFYTYLSLMDFFYVLRNI